MVGNYNLLFFGFLGMGKIMFVLWLCDLLLEMSDEEVMEIVLIVFFM